MWYKKLFSMEILFQFIDYELLTKSILACFIGFAIGIEREYRNKPAGIKTFALICLGATLFTHVSLAMTAPADPSRIAAQIVSGLGFIGAGTIFQSRHMITGLTTAAELWVVGALGTLLGMSMYSEAVMCLVIIYLYFIVSHIIQKFAFRKKKYHLDITVETKENIEMILTWFNQEKIILTQRNWRKKDKKFKIECSYQVTPVKNQEIRNKLKELDYVLGVIG